MGGSLPGLQKVSSHYILTRPHCVHAEEKKRSEVGLGDTDIIQSLEESDKEANEYPG